MPNNTTAPIISSSYEAIVVAYHSLTVTVLGTFLNLATFVILCRPAFRNARLKPTLHYMRAMAIFDILMLYGWNLDHFIDAIYHFTIQRTSIPMCRFLSFYNYFVLQTSAWLRVFVCLDRYISLSRLHKTWFSDPKHVLIIIGSVIGSITLLNSVLLFYGCSYTKTGTIRGQSSAFRLYPLWDYVNLAVYSALPFLFMSLFNSGVIYHLVRLHRESTVRNSQVQHRAISITLATTTILFFLMTAPAIVLFAGFSSKVDIVVRKLLDAILYTYHITSFPLYLVTFHEFRRECIATVTQLVATNTDARARPVNIV